MPVAVAQEDWDVVTSESEPESNWGMDDEEPPMAVDVD